MPPWRNRYASSGLRRMPLNPNGLRLAAPSARFVPGNRFLATFTKYRAGWPLPEQTTGKLRQNSQYHRA
jgi:hypothetical protein